ncbi:polyadenylation and cleavage factor homolog 4-like isoform X1 [Primulina huaijiensis]|uniref:polyadenylation and cleavage factor homolog 4-like isoform X1 n=1 Tax=Primulina huaijiensis TaxID=1492673 RepID=UPI003CC73070
MENLRRPSDRSISKEPGLKKPRLTEVPTASDRSSNGRRGFIQRPVVSNSSAGGLSFLGDQHSESSDSGRGPFPQQLGQQLQHELVTQYKTALAELTFNSKPIITNLTIIAGENSHAAKAIAATICANILEVPSEQKLPSLYLLDSIVKNIGKDYIKSFATRLPEVFCKAYRQVDPSIRQSMRHLFGTWKGVFSPQSLHMIEKELGLTSAVNVSSQGTIASRPDSQSQHPTPSIHVNPKYLEARQQLEITRARGTSIDNNGASMKSTDDVRVPERTSSINYGKTWTGPYAKSIQHQHRVLVNESVHDRNSSTAQVHSDYGPNILGLTSLGGSASGTSKEKGFDRLRYDFGSDVTGKISQQNNCFDTNHGFEPSNSGSHPQHNKNFVSKKIDGINRSWKNLEEEEYTWDEINSRHTDCDAAGTFAKDPRAPGNYGRLDTASRLRRSQSVHDIEPRVDDQASAEGRILSGPDKKPPHVGTLGYGPKISSTPQGQTLGVASSLKPNFMHQHPPSPSFSASEYKQTSVGPPTDPRKLAGLRNMESNDQNSLDSQHLPYRDVNKANKQRLHPQTTSAVNLPLQQRKHFPSTRPKNTKVSGFEPSSGENLFLSQVSASESLPTMVTSSSDRSNPHTVDSPGPGQSITSSLLAAVVQSGILDSSTVTGRSTKTIQESGLESSLGDAQPAISSDPRANFPSRPLLGNTALPAKVIHPPSPPVPPPSSLAGILPEKPPTAVKAVSDPVSSLLSSLVAKGLISSSNSDSLSFTSPIISNQSLDRGPGVPSTSSTPVSFIPGIIEKPFSSSIIDKPSPLKSAAEVSDDMPQSTTKIKNLIGFEFRPDVVRKFNPAVVSELSGLPHQCSICGLGLKCQEQLDRHMDWHVVRDPEQNSSNITSRRWYTDSNDWVAGIGSFHDSDSATDLLGGQGETTESGDHMVPADENQCACILCGELFDDFYSQGRDEWMFKGAVYLRKPSSESHEMTGTFNDNTFLGPIVHANCISDQAVHDLGLACHIELENDA